EEVFQQFLIRHVGAVDRIDVTARTDVDTDILALFCCEAFEDSIIKFYEEGQKVAGGPWVARIVARRQAPFRDVRGTCTACERPATRYGVRGVEPGAAAKEVAARLDSEHDLAAHPRRHAETAKTRRCDSAR